jgi:DNA polymerase delta subunit 2
MPVHPKLINAEVECLSNPCRTNMNGREGLVITQFIIDDFLKYMPRDIGSIQGEGFEYKMHVNESELKHVECTEKQDSDAQHTLNTIRAMEVLMKAGHICPTAPDTLACAPFCGQDPFVIRSRMEYVCCGDAPGFASKRSDSEGTLFFTVPRFSDHHEVVVLSTEDGTLETIRFGQEEFD